MPESPIRTEALEVGRNYRVIYHNPDNRLSREMVAAFLEAEEKVMYFDLRPLAGNTAVLIEWIQEIWTTDKQKMIPTIYRGETRVY